MLQCCVGSTAGLEVGKKKYRYAPSPGAFTYRPSLPLFPLPFLPFPSHSLSSLSLSPPISLSFPSPLPVLRLLLPSPALRSRPPYYG